ncbi:MAG: ATP-binding protein [Rhodospirillaceae bacterium]
MARPVRNRMLPGGLAGRLTLFLVALLIVALWSSAALYIHDRAETTYRLFSESVADRMRAIVPLIERTPRAERDELIRALNSPTLWMAVTERRRPELPREWRRHRRHEDRIGSMLPDLGERRVLIRMYDQWRRQSDALPPMPGGRPAPPDLLDSRVKVLVAVEMRSGGWLNFVASTDTTSLHWAIRIAFWIALATVLIVLLSFWTVHRMTRPLRRFAEAAERIGLDVRSPPLPERGSRELRNATRAFNEMQQRLRRFVDDRTMMLAAISHDLRTMLTRLKLRAEFIEDEEQQRKAVADLDEMQAMLDSTLAFARDDAGHEARTYTDIAALVRSVCDDLADTGQDVTCDAPDRLPFSCAPGAIKRAVQNLVVNALKYGGEAAVSVTDGDDGVEIAVADRGPGIPADLREDVFRPFFRLETSRNRETGGSGLGLAVARSIARRHGGDILLEDRDGGGLLARLFLPHTPIGAAHGRRTGIRTH